MPDLLSMGECMIEFYSEEAMDTAASFQRAFGGDTLNMLVAARRLGTSAGFITRVADDAFGRYLRRGWEREGIDTSRTRSAGRFNGVYFIATSPDGEREFTYYREGSAASGLDLSDVLDIDFQSVRAFHTSGITMALSDSAREAALLALSRAREAGCLTSIDLNYRPRLWTAERATRAMEKALPFASVGFAGIPEDTRPLLGTDDPEECARRMHERGVRVAVLKRGADGAWLSDHGTLRHIPARSYGPAVDTTGAGDAFAGAFLHGLLSGESPEEAGRMGAICAGLKVMGRGAVASLPDASAVRARIASLE